MRIRFWIGRCERAPSACFGFFSHDFDLTFSFVFSYLSNLHCHHRIRPPPPPPLRPRRLHRRRLHPRRPRPRLRPHLQHPPESAPTLFSRNQCQLHAVIKDALALAILPIPTQFLTISGRLRAPSANSTSKCTHRRLLRLTPRCLISSRSPSAIPPFPKLDFRDLV